MSGAEIPSAGGYSPGTVSLPVNYPAAVLPVAGDFQGDDPEIIRRFPNAKPERRAQLAWVEALYTHALTQPEVAVITGLALKTLQNIRTSYGITSTVAARQRERRERPKTTIGMTADADAARLSAYIAEHKCAVLQAGRALGMGKNRTRDLAKRYGIKAPIEAIRAARNADNLRRSADAQRTATKEAAPNRYRTFAQNEQIVAQKRAMWLASGSTNRRVPPPPNAEQLIAEAIAAGRVTRCPTMCAAPVNNGRGIA